MNTFFTAIIYIIGFTIAIFITYILIKLNIEIIKAIIKKAITEKEVETYNNQQAWMGSQQPYMQPMQQPQYIVNQNEYDEFLQWQQSQERNQ